MKLERCRKSARKLSAAGGGNGVIIHGRAEQVIDWLPAGSLDAVHIYYPDPWPKRRHRRRRLLRRDMVAQLTSLLRPGGRLHLVTDFFDYYLQAVVLFLLHPELRVKRDPSLLPEAANLSRYGPRLVALGKSVLCATAVADATGCDAPRRTGSRYTTARRESPPDARAECAPRTSCTPRSDR